MNSRKITLQLTPLLDLLLIIIFTQYLEMDGRIAEQERTVVTRAEAAEQDASRARSEVADLRQQLTSRETTLDQIQQQRDAIAMLLPELFDLPEDTVTELIKTRIPENLRLTPEQVVRLQREFRRLAEERPEAAVRHLLTYDEMRKRCDLWQLYITDKGISHLASEKYTSRFGAESPDDFAAKVHLHYKAIPQPKSLVIILLSYGNISAGTYEAAVEGLPLAIQRMTLESAGRTRFEYGVLGFTRVSPIPDR